MEPVGRLRAAADGTAKAVDQGPDMGEADPFARLVLGAGAPEELEDPLMVLGVDPTAVVGHFKDDAATARCAR